jgi:hypothetical protein
MGEVKNVYKILVGTPEGRDHSEDLGVDGLIILKWISGKQNARLWFELIWLRRGKSGGLL